VLTLISRPQISGEIKSLITHILGSREDRLYRRWWKHNDRGAYDELYTLQRPWEEYMESEIIKAYKLTKPGLGVSLIRYNSNSSEDGI
jgi:hypothetical protein